MDIERREFESVTANSWKELVAILHSDRFMFSLPVSGDHYRSDFVFRGMNDAAWGLRTSLQRLGTPPTQVEIPLLRSFKKYSPPNAFYRDSAWELLSVAQHNGLPTRTLDWTVSPLIACHFATDDRALIEKDGVVWCLDVVKLRDTLPDKLRMLLHSEKQWIFDSPTLDKLFKHLNDLDSEFADAQFVLMFEPPSIDSRIVNQFGILSVANSGDYFQDSIFLAQQDYKKLVTKIIIKASAKHEIRDMLDQNNINERMLYPGLPGLSQWLKRYYSPA